MSKEFAVVMSPHIDDAAISLGEFLRGYRRVLILNVFNKSKVTISGTQIKDVAEQRIEEDKKISQLYGFEFDYAHLPDTNMRGISWRNYNTPIDYSLLREVKNWTKSRLDALGENFTIFIPASYGLHPDHYLVTIAFSSNQLSSYLRQVPFVVYCEQPYYLDSRLVRRTHGGHKYLTENGELTTVPFSTAEKRRMLSVYRSQLSEDRINFLVSENTSEFYWQVDPHFFIKSLSRNKND